MEEKLKNQIENTFDTVFFNLIDETVNSQEPNYDWITSLYIEIKNRLLQYLKKDSKTYKQIDESFDIELFKQMIHNDVFDAESMKKLVDNTFYWIKQLQAPIRDESTEISKQIILNAEKTKTVSTFLKEVYKCLYNYDEDMYNYFKK